MCLINPDKYKLAVAEMCVIKNEISDSIEIYIRDCNTLFTSLTDLEPDPLKDIARTAFGPNYKYAAELFNFSGDDQVGELVIYYTTTANYLLSRIVPAGEDCINIISIDYTSVQKQLDSYSMQQVGYGKYIENFHGMAFQRMLKPEMKSVFTAGAYEVITGYKNEQAKDLMSWLDIVHPDDRDRIRAAGLELYDHPGDKEQQEYRIIRKDGEVRWIHSYDNHFLSNDGKMQMVQGLLVDITEQKELELELQKASEVIREQNIKLEEMNMTDHLTGLSNRRAMQQFLEYLIADYKRTKESFCLLMVDLDNFKGINDKFGHDAGDAVLRGVSRIFQNSLREVDLKSRWGGEEFLLAFPRTNLELGNAIALKLLDKVRGEVFEHNNIDMHMTFSAGLAVYNRSISIETIVKEADRALYIAKESGKNKICTV